NTRRLRAAREAQRMEYIAFDAHQRYTMASVVRPDGRHVREQRIAHERGAFRQFLDRCEPGSPVAGETVGDWHWIAREIEAAGGAPQLVHACKAKLMMGESTRPIDSTSGGSTSSNETVHRRPSGFPPARCATSVTCRGRGWYSSGNARDSRIAFT